ncbi:MAG: hypothetical protein OEZ01_11930 [Candidatus Heimdallarchaeota archaeon]|nr:hypothetical protein [Candidatus Heimdallarchaeota archaeon]
MGLELGLTLLKGIPECPEQKYILVSLVRDPVERKVFNLFHSLVQCMPNWKDHYLEEPGSQEKLLKFFN